MPTLCLLSLPHMYVLAVQHAHTEYDISLPPPHYLRTLGFKELASLSRDFEKTSTSVAQPVCLRQLAKSGLPFYGFAPFHNSLPLGHPDNAAAVSWLIGDAGAADGNPGATAKAHITDGSGVMSRWVLTRW